MIQDCPYCGYKCKVEVSGEADSIDYFVSCQNRFCLLNGPAHKCPVDAIAAFNKLIVMPNPGKAVKV